MLSGGINRVDPPYVIRVTGISVCPTLVGEGIEELASESRKAREWKKQHYGIDTEVSLELRS